jgi:hypothetical protein
MLKTRPYVSVYPFGAEHFVKWEEVRTFLDDKSHKAVAVYTTRFAVVPKDACEAVGLTQSKFQEALEKQNTTGEDRLSVFAPVWQQHPFTSYAWKCPAENLSAMLKDISQGKLPLMNEPPVWTEGE